ncbi:hypothetical protein LTR17_002291 [Elasticomyces elasticus]|nr:hypothetical protein LTR17_002291 [Elasticomyces elasticus]
MIWTTQMQWWRKLNASLWFSLAIILDGFIIARLSYTPEHLFWLDFTFDAITFFIILTVELHIVIMNAAYPNLLSFLSKTSTGFMNTVPTVSTSGSHNANSQFQRIKLRNDPTSRISAMAKREEDGISMKSFNSQQIMISKSVTITDEQDGKHDESGYCSSVKALGHD